MYILSVAGAGLNLAEGGTAEFSFDRLVMLLSSIFLNMVPADSTLRFDLAQGDI